MGSVKFLERNALRISDTMNWYYPNFPQYRTHDESIIFDDVNFTLSNAPLKDFKCWRSTTHLLYTDNILELNFVYSAYSNTLVIAEEEGLKDIILSERNSMSTALSRKTMLPIIENEMKQLLTEAGPGKSTHYKFISPNIYNSFYWDNSGKFLMGIMTILHLSNETADATTVKESLAYLPVNPSFQSFSHYRNFSNMATEADILKGILPIARSRRDVNKLVSEGVAMCYNLDLNC